VSIRPSRAALPSTAAFFTPERGSEPTPPLRLAHVPVERVNELARDRPWLAGANFAAVASDPPAAATWVDAPFAEQLDKVAAGLLAEQPPFVLMTLRGRLYMRMQLDAPEPDPIGQAVDLFEVAAYAAVRVGGGVAEPPPDFPSTASTAWQTDILPEDPKDRGAR